MKAIILISMLFVATMANVPTVTFCDEAAAASAEFQVDLSQTYTVPKDVEKKEHITLYMNGYFNDDVQLKELELDVYWNDALL